MKIEIISLAKPVVTTLENADDKTKWIAGVAAINDNQPIPNDFKVMVNDISQACVQSNQP